MFSTFIGSEDIGNSFICHNFLIAPITFDDKIVFMYGHVLASYDINIKVID